MMSQTNIALVNFEGLRVPRFVRFLGAELRCYPHRPRQPVCKTCFKLGHRADQCPTLDVTICEQWGIENPVSSHPCSPRCKSYGGDHPTTEPKCPQRQRQPINRVWVKKATEDERWQLNASPNVTPPSAITLASGTSFKKAGRSRSKTPSRSGPKTRANFPEIARLRRDIEARHAHMHAQLDAAIECTNARIQAAIESARQVSLALQQEIISVMHASEERTHALFPEVHTVPSGKCASRTGRGSGSVDRILLKV
ncbi:hypothetical protein HPB49_003894 [Dermacentor silvarum]|uniref:Uncharacterized protein n=1 Tax=Dermacentor silvarum TaxID=543639 RepID=A0ACB8DMV5_DERSI|nr:hypothetical protein HPB49_003894 [Dermacentor silvarum]